MQNNDFIDDGLFEGIYKDIDRVSQQTQAMLEARGVMRNSPDWNKAFDGLSDKVKSERGRILKEEAIAAGKPAEYAAYRASAYMNGFDVMPSSQWEKNKRGAIEAEISDFIGGTYRAIEGAAGGAIKGTMSAIYDFGRDAIDPRYPSAMDQINYDGIVRVREQVEADRNRARENAKRIRDRIGTPNIDGKIWSEDDVPYKNEQQISEAFPMPEIPQQLQNKMLYKNEPERGLEGERMGEGVKNEVLKAWRGMAAAPRATSASPLYAAVQQFADPYDPSNMNLRSDVLQDSSGVGKFSGTVVGTVAVSAPAMANPAWLAMFAPMGYAGGQERLRQRYEGAKEDAMLRGAESPSAPSISAGRTAGVSGAIFEVGSEGIGNALEMSILLAKGARAANTISKGGRKVAESGADTTNRLSRNFLEGSKSNLGTRGIVAAAKSAGTVAKVGAVEAGEEVANVAAQTIFIDTAYDDASLARFWNESLDVIPVAFAAGGVTGVGAMGANKVRQRKENIEIGRTKAAAIVTRVLDQISDRNALQRLSGMSQPAMGTAMAMHQLDDYKTGRRMAITVDARHADVTMTDDVKTEMSNAGINVKTPIRQGNLLHYTADSMANDVMDSAKAGDTEFITGLPNYVGENEPVAGAFLLRNAGGQIVEIVPYGVGVNKEAVNTAMEARANMRGLTVGEASSQDSKYLSDTINAQLDSDRVDAGGKPRTSNVATRPDVLSMVQNMKAQISARVMEAERQAHEARQNEERATAEANGETFTPTPFDGKIKVNLKPVATKKLSEGERQLANAQTPATILEGNVEITVGGQTREIDIPMDGVYDGQISADGVFLIRENGTAMTFRSAFVAATHEGMHRGMYRSRGGAHWMNMLFNIDPTFSLRAGASYWRRYNPMVANSSDAEVINDMIARYEAAQRVLGDASQSPEARAKAQASMGVVQRFAEETVAETATQTMGASTALAAEHEGVYRQTEGAQARKFLAWLSHTMQKNGFYGKHARAVLDMVGQRARGVREANLTMDAKYRKAAIEQYEKNMREAAEYEAQLRQQGAQEGDAVTADSAKAAGATASMRGAEKQAALSGKAAIPPDEEEKKAQAESGGIMPAIVPAAIGALQTLAGASAQIIPSGSMRPQPRPRAAEGTGNEPAATPAPAAVPESAANAARDGGGGRAVRTLAPLAGAPQVSGATGPDPNLVDVAEQYAAENGIRIRRQSEYAKVDPTRAARIAEAYDKMQHSPSDPAVREAYDDMIAQTVAQYRALERNGYKFWLFDEKTDPYEGKPWRAMRDLRANKSMGVFSTEAGFGTQEFDASQNPLLVDTGIMWPTGSPNGPMRRVLANDLFRAVHDSFGHGLEGAGFRYDGEENAWQAHVRLFTGKAIAAMTSETRGQNSWLNFGPFGEKNRTAGLEETVFADQKSGLMEPWTWEEGRVSDMEDGTRFSLRPISQQEMSPAMRVWSRGSKAVNETGALVPLYHGTEVETNFDQFNPSRSGVYGGGIYLSSDVATANKYAPERENGRVIPAVVNIRNPFVYDASSPSASFLESVAQATGTPFADLVSDSDLASTALKNAGYDGVHVIAPNGVDEIGRSRGDYWIAYSPNQVKGYFNENPTADPRMMYSLREEQPSLSRELAMVDISTNTPEDPLGTNRFKIWNVPAGDLRGPVNPFASKFGQIKRKLNDAVQSGKPIVGVTRKDMTPDEWANWLGSEGLPKDQVRFLMPWLFENPFKIEQKPLMSPAASRLTPMQFIAEMDNAVPIAAVTTNLGASFGTYRDAAFKNQNTDYSEVGIALKFDSNEFGSRAFAPVAVGSSAGKIGEMARAIDPQYIERKPFTHFQYPNVIAHYRVSFPRKPRVIGAGSPNPNRDVMIEEIQSLHHFEMADRGIGVNRGESWNWHGRAMEFAVFDDSIPETVDAGFSTSVKSNAESSYVEKPQSMFLAIRDSYFRGEYDVLGNEVLQSFSNAGFEIRGDELAQDVAGQIMSIGRYGRHYLYEGEGIPSDIAQQKADSFNAAMPAARAVADEIMQNFGSGQSQVLWINGLMYLTTGSTNNPFSDDSPEQYNSISARFDAAAETANLKSTERIEENFDHYTEQIALGLNEAHDTGAKESVVAVVLRQVWARMSTAQRSALSDAVRLAKKHHEPTRSEMRRLDADRMSATSPRTEMEQQSDAMKAEIRAMEAVLYSRFDEARDFQNSELLQEIADLKLDVSRGLAKAYINSKRSAIEARYNRAAFSSLVSIALAEKVNEGRITQPRFVVQDNDGTKALFLEYGLLRGTKDVKVLVYGGGTKVTDALTLDTDLANTKSATTTPYDLAILFASDMSHLEYARRNMNVLAVDTAEARNAQQNGTIKEIGDSNWISEIPYGAQKSLLRQMVVTEVGAEKPYIAPLTTTYKGQKPTMTNDWMYAVLASAVMEGVARGAQVGNRIMFTRPEETPSASMMEAAKAVSMYGYDIGADLRHMQTEPRAQHPELIPDAIARREGRNLSDKGTVRSYAEKFFANFDAPVVYEVYKIGNKKPYGDMPRMQVVLNDKLIAAAKSGNLTPLFSMRRGIVGATDETRRVFTDERIELRRYTEEERRRRAGNLPDAMNPYQGSRVMSARIGARIGRLERQYADILHRMDGDGINRDTMSQFLTAQHARERNDYIASVNPAMPDGGSGMTNAEADLILANHRASGAFATMDRYANEWRNILNEGLLDRLISGLITQATYNRLTRQYQHYVPLRGRPAEPFDEDFEGQTAFGRGMSTQGRGMPRALGRQSRANDVTSQVGFVAEDTVRRIERNRVANRFLRLVLATNDVGMAQVIRPSRRTMVDGEVRPVFDYDWMSGEAGKRNFGLFLDADMMIDGEQYRQGDLVVIHINNRRLADGMLAAQDMSSIADAIEVPNHFFRMMTTGLLNPSFATKNAVRDLLMGTIRNYARNGILDTVAQTARWPLAFLRILNDEWRGTGPTGSYERYVEAGGDMTFARGNDLTEKVEQFDEIERRVRNGDPNATSMIRYAVGWYPALFKAAETATRLAHFNQRVSRFARGGPMTDEQGALSSRDVTVDFQKKGSWGRVLNRTHLYMNASIQGSANTLKALGEAKELVPTLVAIGFIQSLLARLNAGDDEKTGLNRWDMESPYDKAANLYLYKSDKSGKYVRMPQAYGFNVFTTLGGDIADAVFGERTKPSDVVANFVDNSLNYLNAFGGSGVTKGMDNMVSFAFPTLMRWMPELANNSDFAGRAIHPEQPFGAETTQAFKAFENTPEIYRQLAEGLAEMGGGNEIDPPALPMMDIHPDTLEYMVGFMFSGLGRTIQRLHGISTGEMESSEFPIIRDFMGSSAQNNKFVVSEYNKIKGETQVEEARIRAMRSPDAAQRNLGKLNLDVAGEVPAIANTDRVMRRIRDAIKVAETDEEKKQLREMRMQLMRDVIRRRNEKRGLTPPS